MLEAGTQPFTRPVGVFKAGIQGLFFLRRFTWIPAINTPE